MSFELQQINVGSSNTATFTFSDTISQFIVGFNHFDYAYGNSNDHAIETMALKLTTNLISVDNGTNNAVQVTIARTFNDASGADYDISKCTLELSCLALLGTDLNASLIMQGGIDNNASSNAVGVSGTNDTAFAILSGFNFSYGSDTDHWLQACNAAAGVNNTNAGYEISSSAAMSDHSGNSATASIDGGLFVYSNFNSTNLLMQTHTYQTIGGTKVIDFGQSISSAAVFVQSWNMTSDDDDDHRVLTFYVGPYQTDIDLNAGTVTLYDPCIYVKDDKSLRQDDSLSDITVVVMATT